MRLLPRPLGLQLGGVASFTIPKLDTPWICVSFAFLLSPFTCTLPCTLLNLRAYARRGLVLYRAAAQVVQAEYLVEWIWPLFLCLIRNSHKCNKSDRVSFCQISFIAKGKPIFYGFPRFLTNNILYVRYWPSLVWECSRITRGLMKSLTYRNLENGVRLSHLRASLIACDQVVEEPRWDRSRRWCRSLTRWTCHWLCARWRLSVKVGVTRDKFFLQYKIEVAFCVRNEDKNISN
jgi:hypothetical protein